MFTVPEAIILGFLPSAISFAYESLGIHGESLGIIREPIVILAYLGVPKESSYRPILSLRTPYSRKLGIQVPGKLFQYRLRDYSADGKVTLMSQGRFM